MGFDYSPREPHVGTSLRLPCMCLTISFHDCVFMSIKEVMLRIYQDSMSLISFSLKVNLQSPRELLLLRRDSNAGVRSRSNSIICLQGFKLLGKAIKTQNLYARIIGSQFNFKYIFKKCRLPQWLLRV